MSSQQLLCLGFSRRNMLIALMFLVVAMKSRTFFPISHIQLTSRCAGAGREQSQTERQAGQWKYSIPWMSCSVYEWALARGQEAFCSSCFHEFESSVVQEFKLLWEFIFFVCYAKFSKMCEFGVLRSLLGDWLWIGHWVVRKIVLCKVCFTY